MAAGDITIVIKQVTKKLGTDVNTVAFITAAELPAAFTDKTISIQKRSNNGQDVIYDVIATGVANA